MKSLKYFRNRTHRCFELTAQAMLREPDANSFTLIHGVIQPHRLPIAHSWILTTGDQIYDAVKDCYTTRDEYFAGQKAREERRYTREQMAGEIARSGHSGPWHVTEAATLASR